MNKLHNAMHKLHNAMNKLHNAMNKLHNAMNKLLFDKMMSVFALLEKHADLNFIVLLKS
jgi:hypothetical protein